MDSLDLRDKVVLVTGGARGIGFETARLAREQGARVALVDLDPGIVGESAEALGGDTLGLAADVTDLRQVESAVSETIGKFGRIDIVLASAGITPPKTTVRAIDPVIWEKVIEVNVIGVYNTVKATIEPVIESGGHMVLIASVYATANGVINTSYAASKAGVEALGRSLRVELEPHGASAGVAYFGFVETDLIGEIFDNELADAFRAEIAPAFLTRKMPVGQAAQALIDGFRSRAPRIIEPPAWRAPILMRGQVGPISDRQLERNPRAGEFIRQFEERDIGPEAAPVNPPVKSGDPYALGGKTVLVTGGAQGIGLEIARQAHGRGASVAILDLDQDAADAAAQKIGPRAAGFACDVTSQEALDRAFSGTRERFGRIDVVVANAGIGPTQIGPIRTEGSEQWNRIYGVDLLGVWRTVRTGLEDVIANGGQFVLVSSSYAFMNGVMNSAYATAKAGVEAFGRGLRAELTPLGASATVAYFGWIDTELVAGAFEDPLIQRIREDVTPGWMTRTVPVSKAGKVVIEALESRQPRAIAPTEWKGLFYVRGLIGPAFDKRLDEDEAIAEIVPQAEDRAGS
ncbi:MAG: SDR family NAD(P)-dependent oxidoreductase [Solirubrobacterales bacterium]|nr:SDR family NAD(P)-dependent oxidoreductase [Solirubrobacterales bacterium]MCB8914413.1 SDR family NAD(P)-dependent oxidoreductase [Thermoleophilales bacterium]